MADAGCSFSFLVITVYNRLMTPEWTDFIWKSFWNLVATSGMGFLLFKAWGEKWLQKRFDAQLADLKHKQQKELDKNRDEVQRIFNRIVKIHEKEFEVYPQAWLMLQTLQGTAFHAVTSGIGGGPDFHKMKDAAALDAFLAETEFTDYQKDLLRKGETVESREEMYSRFEESRRLDASSEAARLMKNYLLLNEVFMTPEIAQHFSEFHGRIQKALVEYGIGRNLTDKTMYLKAVMVLSDTNPHAFVTLKEAIQARLGFPATLPPTTN